MMENMISVVVITYNQEATISRTLDSILMQQCHVPIEIVIGEDCSTDNTRAICQRYAEKHPDTIRLFCNQQNKGIVDNYFDCLLECRGKYIADCAGDDFWTDPQKLEKEVCVMEAHDNVTMVITNWQYFDEKNQKSSPSQQQQHAPITPGRDLLKAIITQYNMSVFHLCTALYRNDVFRKAYEEDTYLFRNKGFCSEDIQIAFSMALHGDIAYLPDVTLSYSIGQDTVSNSIDDVKQFQFVRKMTDLIHYLATKHSLDIGDFFPERIFALGMHAFRAHQPQLYQETLECEKRWHVNRTLKNRILFTVMRREWLWKMGLSVRQTVVRLKRVCR